MAQLKDTTINGYLSLTTGRLKPLNSSFIVTAAPTNVYYDIVNVSLSQDLWAPDANTYQTYTLNYLAQLDESNPRTYNETSFNVKFNYSSHSGVGSEVSTIGVYAAFKGTTGSVVKKGPYTYTLGKYESDKKQSITLTSSDLTTLFGKKAPATISVTYMHNGGGTYMCDGITLYGKSGANNTSSFAFSMRVTTNTFPSNAKAISICTGNSTAVSTYATHIGGFDSAYPVVIGVAGTAWTGISSYGSTWTTLSDARDKTDIKVIDKSLEFINRLSPCTFRMNLRDNYIDSDGNFNNEEYLAATKSSGRRIAGFIAQDVYKSMIDVYENSNYANIVDYSRYNYTQNEKDIYTMRYDTIIPFLTGAIQELSAKLDSATNKITELENTISEMKNNQQSLNS